MMGMRVSLASVSEHEYTAPVAPVDRFLLPNTNALGRNAAPRRWGVNRGLIRRLVFRPRAIELFARQAATVLLVGLIKGVPKSADALSFRPQHIAAIVGVDRLVNDVWGIALRIQTSRSRNGGFSRRTR